MNELSIIIPCVSSVEAVPKFIDMLAAYLMSNPSETDIILAVNEKAGDVGEVVNYVQKKYPWLKFEALQRSGGPRSYGALARFALAYSTSQYAVLVSPHDQEDIALINGMLQKIKQGNQVVQAISPHSEADTNLKQILFNIYRSIFRLLAQLMVGVNIKSATNSFKMFDRVFVQATGLTQNGHSICPEIIFKVLLANGGVDYITSNIKSKPIDKDFKVYKEGIGYLWLLIRGLMHRLGILWF